MPYTDNAYYFSITNTTNTCFSSFVSLVKIIHSENRFYEILTESRRGKYEIAACLPVNVSILELHNFYCILLSHRTQYCIKCVRPNAIFAHGGPLPQKWYKTFFPEIPYFPWFLYFLDL